MDKNFLENFIRAEQSVHNMARLLAAIAKTFVAAKTDYSHTNLRWCEINHHLETRNFVLPDGRPVWISYHPAHLHFHVYVNDEKDNKRMVLVKNNSLTFVKNKFISILNNLGLGGDSFVQNMNFRFPELLNNNGKLFIPDKTLLHQVESIRNEVNLYLHEYLRLNGLQSEVRVWTYDFDTCIYCKHDGGVEQYAGYAPADDEVCSTPYYYNYFYKNGKRLAPEYYSPISFGRWETGAWSGAVLAMDQFETVEAFNMQVLPFLQESSGIYLSNINKEK